MNQTRAIIAGGLAMLASAASAFGGTNDLANVVSNDAPTLAGSSFASTNDVSNIASNDYSVAGVVSNDYPVAMATVTNRPHIMGIGMTTNGAYVGGLNVVLSATNFTPNVKYGLLASIDLTDPSSWVNKGTFKYSGSLSEVLVVTNKLKRMEKGLPHFYKIVSQN